MLRGHENVPSMILHGVIDLPWDDVWGVVDAKAWVMGEDEMLHPRSLHLLIQGKHILSGRKTSDLTFSLFPSVVSLLMTP